MTRAYATDRFAIPGPRSRDRSITPLGFKQFRLVPLTGSVPTTYYAVMLLR